MNKQRLFLGSCFSLVSTSVTFAVVGAIMGALKAEFVLSNEQVGYIGGAAIWGFTISIIVLGPLCDALGMKNLMRFAFVCHILGPLVMMLARGDAAFWMLFGGALIVSLGNGTVEAACNPLVTTLYPDQKTKKLNLFHVWFPGGIVIGGVASYLLDQAEVGDWRLKLALIFIPTIVYGILFIGQRFPATERVQSGLSFADMVRGALLRPLFLILLACMCITASLELGPNRWIPPVFGILVLSYVSLIMAILRSFGGPIVHRLWPTGVLVTSAVLAGLGIMWMSLAESTATIYAGATVFALGVCFFWPTMLGVVSERVPRSGALGLAMMGGAGMLMVGLVTTPQMGRVGDHYVSKNLPVEQTRAVLQRVVDEYPALSADQAEAIRQDAQDAVAAAKDVLSAGGLEQGKTAKALRTAVKGAPGDDAQPIVDTIGGLLGPADEHGLRMSFRYLAPFSLIIIIIFGLLYLRDRAAGGYKAESIGGGGAPADEG